MKNRDYVLIALCVWMAGLFLGNIWGSHSTRTTFERTQTYAVPGILNDIVEINKELDKLNRAVFGTAK